LIFFEEGKSDGASCKPDPAKRFLRQAARNTILKNSISFSFLTLKTRALSFRNHKTNKILK